LVREIRILTGQKDVFDGGKYYLAGLIVEIWLKK